jgi:hypothetical protein
MAETREWARPTGESISVMSEDYEPNRVWALQVPGRGAVLATDRSALRLLAVVTQRGRGGPVRGSRT